MEKLRFRNYHAPEDKVEEINIRIETHDGGGFSLLWDQKYGYTILMSVDTNGKAFYNADIPWIKDYYLGEKIKRRPKI